MIFYLTYNDAYSGIYSSQVIDVVQYLNQNFRTSVRLVAFISLRDFFINRRKIKTELPRAYVLPMFPGVHRWRSNHFLLSILSFFLRPKAIIGRSVLATNLALRLKNKFGIRKVVYDGRGAIAAEWKEYKVVTHTQMLAEIAALEQVAILQADFRIVVSEQLKIIWRNTYDYKDFTDVIIPCTVNKVFENVALDQAAIDKRREQFGIKNNDVVLIYSGSVAGWQSFDLLYQFVKPFLEASINHKLFFLSSKDESIASLAQTFPNQILCEKVLPNEVPNYLILGDYGLLIREKSITNKVASPVKFAEYLSCGLNVIISEDLGDYSEFVALQQCGMVVASNSNLSLLKPINYEDKLRHQELARKYFYKNSELNQIQYSRLLAAIS